MVRAANGAALVAQWTNVHGLAPTPTARDTVDGFPREVWRDAAGREMVESFAIRGMGHGTPLHVGDEDRMCGAAGAFLLDVGISSSYHIAKFWGLTGGTRRTARPKDVAAPSRDIALVSPDGTVRMPAPAAAEPARRTRKPSTPPPSGPPDIGAVIGNALRAAGLMK